MLIVLTAILAALSAVAGLLLAMLLQRRPKQEERTPGEISAEKAFSEGVNNVLNYVGGRRDKD